MAISDYYAEKKKKKQEAKEYLLSLIPQLKQANIAVLAGFFAGSGDEGFVEDIKGFAAGAVEVEDVRTQGTLDSEGVDLPSTFDRNKIEDAVDNICPDGYEDNEGGFGAVILDVEAGKVRLNYSYNVVSSEEDDEEV